AAERPSADPAVAAGEARRSATFGDFGEDGLERRRLARVDPERLADPPCERSAGQGLEHLRPPAGDGSFGWKADDTALQGCTSRAGAPGCRPAASLPLENPRPAPHPPGSGGGVWGIRRKRSRGDDVAAKVPGTSEDEGMATTEAHRVIRAPRGPERSCKGWTQEAALRMLMNNLDPEVAERPEDLVVYGGTGKAARSWEAFDAIVRTLRELENDETLLIQSGKPVAVFRTHRHAPRVLIANSNLVPRWATWDHFHE